MDLETAAALADVESRVARLLGRVEFLELNAEPPLVPAASPPRNVVINGAFDIWQRGTAFTGLAAGTYFADRWRVQFGGSTIADRTTDTPDGFRYATRMQRAGAVTSHSISSRLEAADVEHLVGLPVTFSVWFKTGNATTHRVRLQLAYPTAVDDWTSSTVESVLTVDATTSWVRYSVTIPALAAEYAAGLEVRVAALGTNDLDWYVTGVQLAQADELTPFQRVGSSLQAELAACHRYYYRITGAAASDGFGPAVYLSTTVATTLIALPCPMRTVPTLESSAASTFEVAQSTTRTASAVSLANAASEFVGFVNFTTAAATVNTPALTRAASAGAYLGFMAEL